jgi:hypothetical protein
MAPILKQIDSRMAWNRCISGEVLLKNFNQYKRYHACTSS